MSHAMDFYNSPPMLDEADEFIDYEAILPQDDMMPMDFKFPKVSMFQDLIEQRRAGTLPSGLARDPKVFEVSLLSVVSPSDFYFTLSEHNSFRDEMNIKLKKFFIPTTVNNHMPPGMRYLIPPEMVRDGMAVISLRNCPIRPVFRGYVRHATGEHTCRVWDLDGARTMEVYKKNLHFIPKIFAHFPEFAYTGKLTGVFPFDGPKAPWTDYAIKIFRSMCAGFGHLAVIRYFSADGKSALYLRTPTGEWVDEEMVARRAATKDPTIFEQLLDRISGHDSEEAAILEERFDLPHPRYFNLPLPDEESSQTKSDMWAQFEEDGLIGSSQKKCDRLMQ